MGSAQDAAQLSIVHRTASIMKNYTSPNAVTGCSLPKGRGCIPVLLDAVNLVSCAVDGVTLPFTAYLKAD